MKAGHCANSPGPGQQEGADMAKTTTRPGAPAKFLRDAVQTRSDDCIPWPFQVTHDGYGIVTTGWLDGRRSTTTAHRAALILAVGPPPEPDMQAAHDPHTCTESTCVNPRHLSWKSPQENTDDRLITGSTQRKLTDAQVVAIIHDQRGPSEIAIDYGVTQAFVTMIKKGRRRPRAWKRSGLELPEGARFE